MWGERETDLLDVISSDAAEVMASCHHRLHLHKVLLHPSSDLLCTAPTATNCSTLLFFSLSFSPICYIVSITPQNTILKEKREGFEAQGYTFLGLLTPHASKFPAHCSDVRRERERESATWDKNQVLILPWWSKMLTISRHLFFFNLKLWNKQSRYGIILCDIQLSFNLLIHIWEQIACEAVYLSIN